jgi:hypothetical protein
MSLLMSLICLKITFIIHFWYWWRFSCLIAWSLCFSRWVDRSVGKYPLHGEWLISRGHFSGEYRSEFITLLFIVYSRRVNIKLLSESACCPCFNSLQQTHKTTIAICTCLEYMQPIYSIWSFQTSVYSIRCLSVHILCTLCVACFN